MQRGDTGMLAPQPADARADGRVDGDVVSRFATCCRALGIEVYQRRRPADLAAARAGFTALTRVAHDQCDAWTGLAAAGDASLRVLEAVARTADSAGTLQRQVELAPGALGFRYDTGLAALSNLDAGNDARTRIVLKELRDKVADVAAMRAQRDHE